MGKFASTDELMEADGWTNLNGNGWSIELDGALRLPRISAGRIVRQKVIYLESADVIHNVVVGPATKASRIIKRL